MYRCLYADGEMSVSSKPITPDGRKVIVNEECEKPAVIFKYCKEIIRYIIQSFN